MSKERRSRKKTPVEPIIPGREDISPELRGILEQLGEEAEIDAGVDAALEEGVIVTREDILRMARAQRPSRKKKPEK